MEKPVPNNIEHIPKMDGFMKEILKEGTKPDELQVEATIEKIQNKTRDIYGSLANIWQYLEGLNAALDDTVDIDMKYLLSCIQQVVLL